MLKSIVPLLSEATSSQKWL